MFVLIKTFKTNFKSDTTNLVWVVDSITGVNETTEKRLNQILKDNGYEYEISFRCVDFFSDDKKDPVSKIEKLKNEQVDILCIPINKSNYSGHSVGLEMVNKNLLVCLDGEFSKETLKTMQSKGISLATTINGKHYGISTVGICASKTCWYADYDWLEKSNLQVSDLKNKELWQITELLNNDKNTSDVIMDIGECDSMLLNLKYEFITDYIGVRLDDDSCTIRNILEDEYTIEYLDALHELAMKGTLSKNDFKNAALYLSNVEYMSYASQDEGKQEIAVWKDYYSYNLTNMQQGVASWSKHKSEAKKVLEILFTDEEIQMYLNYGSDCEDYKFQNGKVIDQNQKEQFNDGWSDFLVGDFSYLRKYASEDILCSPVIGFTFDDSGLEDDLKKLQLIYDEAEKNYFYVFEDENVYKKKIHQLHKKLRNSGISEIQKEISRQLESYKNVGG